MRFGYVSSAAEADLNRSPYLALHRNQLEINMLVLTLNDVEISSAQHPKWPKRIPTLSYQDKAFGLRSVFRVHQQAEAQASLRDLISNERRMCVLLEELRWFSLWQLIRID